MIVFQIKTADRVAAVRVWYNTTLLFCKDYLCGEEPDFSLEITPKDLAFERGECLRLGLDIGSSSENDMEVLALLRKISEKLIEYDTLLFHGSCIAVDGVGYLFTAPSGTGKSTHTRLWRELLGDRAVMVNDDKPFLKMTESGVLAYGSPWNGKHRLDTNTRVPLKAICILERGTENTIRRIPAKEALVTLFQQSGRPRDMSQMPRYMDQLDKLAASVIFYRLHCNMDPEAARVAYETMCGEKPE